ncbi:DUF4191 family protein [Canibacter sp. lx-45]|uniref:DUF4191 domain-containing protein n=1 Tax=Canibacter zhuwentaonis TaxID=2837491 RepID=UPI001BDC9D5E|nr:DUF4191 domain-containing protein [Canibacter zhuwentaonis]MBT1035149.1 DUF4191 family protein [Canibacter zhuwentaonis]
MAKKDSTKRSPGRIKQMIQVYKTTAEYDKTLPVKLIIAFLLPIALAVLVAALLPGTNIAGWILWPITGVLLGILLAMVILGKRAEAMAYAQIEGQPGAVGAVLSGGLRRSYRGSETPVAIAPRTRDAVYRAVGKGGIVLVGEGNPNRLEKLIQKETAHMKRILPNVPVTSIFVGREKNSQVALPKLAKEIYRTKKALKRGEVQQVHMRIESLSSAPLAMPKGIDPNRIRKPRKPR